MLKVTFTTRTAQQWAVCKRLKHSDLLSGYELESLRSNSFSRDMGGTLYLPNYYHLTNVEQVPDEELPEECR